MSIQHEMPAVCRFASQSFMSQGSVDMCRSRPQLLEVTGFSSKRKKNSDRSVLTLGSGVGSSRIGDAAHILRWGGRAPASRGLGLAIRPLFSSPDSSRRHAHKERSAVCAQLEPAMGSRAAISLGPRALGPRPRGGTIASSSETRGAVQQKQCGVPRRKGKTKGTQIRRSTKNPTRPV